MENGFMHEILLYLYGRARNIGDRLKALKDESGQDLIEYALVVALIAFAATVGMRTVANNINTAFSNLATTLSGAVAPTTGGGTGGTT
jgi:pilus assembly protein Flp/PilA